MALFKVLAVAPQIEETSAIYVVTEAKTPRDAYQAVVDTLEGKGNTSVFPFVLDEKGGEHFISNLFDVPLVVEDPF